jgi:hypothetical protein
MGGGIVSTGVDYMATWVMVEEAHNFEIQVFHFVEW